MANSPGNNLKLETIRQIRLISEKEKELVREVWKEVEKDYKTIGRDVFKDLFAAHPAYTRFFVEMLSPDEDIFANVRFQKHMLQVLLPTLGGVIDNLDYPEAIHEAMKRLGVFHKRKELGLRKENVDNLTQSLLSTLRADLKHYSQEQEEALTKVLSIVMVMFSNSLEGKT